ncbi:MAG: hypothetical protein H6872_08365 [Methylobacteriaceae bacterium]|nr:hypothetical protein [Methylobacteriaceae bacterium]
MQPEGTDLAKGYRTILVGLVLAIGPAALQFLGAVDWSGLIGPTGAFFVSGVVAILMRFFTTTPGGKARRDARRRRDALASRAILAHRGSRRARARDDGPRFLAALKAHDWKGGGETGGAR